MRRRTRLTPLAVERLKAPKTGRDEYADTLVPGLTLRVSDSGRRTYSLLYRVRGQAADLSARGLPKKGRLRRLNLLATELGAARAEARTALELADVGKDPVQERHRQINANRELAADTFGALAAQFLEEHRKARNRPSVYAASMSTLDRLILPHWGERPITEITTRDVNSLLRATKALVASPGAKVRRGAPNKVLIEARAVFAFARREGLLVTNPTDGVKMPVAEPPRDRVLLSVDEEGRIRSLEELRRIWLAAGELGYPFGQVFRMLILTGQRRDEVARMRWSDLEGLHGDTPVWHLAGESTKSGRAHDVPLSSAAATLLRELPRFGHGSARNVRMLAGYCFSSTGGEKPVSGFSKAKSRLDATLIRDLRDEAIAAGEAPDEIEVPRPWRIHDLRRSAATGIAALGFPPHVVGAVLNHSPGATHGVTAIYVKHRYGAEKRKALEAWSECLGSAVAERPFEANGVLSPRSR